MCSEEAVTLSILPQRRDLAEVKWGYIIDHVKICLENDTATYNDLWPNIYFSYHLG